MNEETTTSTQVDESQAATESQQPDTTTEQAVQDVEETSETTSSDSVPAEESDEEIKSWAEKKGLKLDDPIALAKMIREGDKKVTEASQKASELGKSVDTASSEIGLDDVAALKNQVAVMQFYQTYPDARQMDSEMAKTLEEKPYFANDLEGLYFYTKGLQADKDLVAARQAGSKEALAASAQAERATTPRASATNRQAPSQISDDEIAGMTLKQYDDAIAAGKITPWGPRP